MINIGIIGCGHWGGNHVRIFNSCGEAKVKICCDRDPTRLNALHRTHRGLVTTVDYNRVLKDKTIDAVVIATPTAAHYNLAKAALLCDKHVLCEKPLAINQSETLDLVSLAKKNKKVLMVGYVFLFNNGIIALKNCIASGELGKILYLHFTRTNLGPIRSDVDVIHDLATHDISIASFLLGKWPKNVAVNAGFFLRKNISDIAFLTLYYPNNILVNIHVSWLDPGKVRKITCVGDKKMALWDDLHISEPIRIFNKSVIKKPFYSDYGEFQLLPREGEVVSPLVKLTEPLKNQNIHFLDCIMNKKMPLADGEFGHKVTKVLEGIRASLRNRGRIQAIRC